MTYECEICETDACDGLCDLCRADATCWDGIHLCDACEEATHPLGPLVLA